MVPSVFYATCENCFAAKYELLDHIALYHYYCSKCDKQIITKKHLKTHIESIHQGVHYSCNQWFIYPTNNSYLKTHTVSISWHYH